MGHEVTNILFGALVGAVFLLIARARGWRGELALYATGLVVAALIYVSFALFRSGLTHLTLEAAGLVGYSLAAAAGLRRWPALLGSAWIAHGAWDLFVPAHAQAYVPAWYPAWCAGLDWLVGAYIVVKSRSLRQVG
ncbi:MAG TPA: hypothetical protein VMT38_01665 [Terracidiphilus sp.]|nr:hypothetical protein [Terracidiphilus sp.]